MYGSNGSGPSKLADFFDIKDASFGSKWATSKVPIETLHEAYFDDKLDIKEGTDLLESMYRRHSYSTFQFTWAQVKFFVLQFIPEVLVHSREQDVDQVCTRLQAHPRPFCYFIIIVVFEVYGCWIFGAVPLLNV